MFKKDSFKCNAAFPLGVFGGKMIDGIWKILLGNDRLQKSRVRRFKKQLKRLNQFGCLKPVVPVLGFALAGWSLQPGFCKRKTNHFS